EYPPKVYRVDIEKGRHKTLVKSPVSQGRFLTDQQHNVRFVTGYDEDNNYTTWLYRNEEWRSTADLNIDNENFDPISIKGDTNQVYAFYAENGEPRGLYLFNLDSGKKQKIFQHPKVSLTGYKADRAGEVYAVEYEDSYPATKIINKNHPDAKALQLIVKALPGYITSVVSETLDGTLKVVRVNNQFSPDAYLLYDVKKNQLSYLFNSRSWVNADNSANVVPFKFKARDGIEIAGYVTLPLGADTLKDAKNLPFIVNVHGGPHGVRDYMQYDSENQLYASRGIAVLQVNYRGSSGYGQKFTELGYKHWGDTVQFDIIDGIKALVSQGTADKKRLCIIGASFGGYSALQSSIIAPDLFQCAVGIIGVYDLELMHETGNIRKRKSGRAYLEKVIGTDKNVLRANSPVRHLDKLKIPVLIVHGGEDKQVPVEHAQKLKEGLEKQGLPHQWMLLDDEGHGFYKPEHRAAVYQRTLRFLQQHLKMTK
ncbi:MAG: prolyl oligopeptidase family serine peptidase, partial [Psychrosphaera sp.]|nr:prolyl oligopeptidase family serine peptidase [Psychrosphaera sp.]